MHEEVCYGKSFLKQVVVRVDFAVPLEKMDKSPPVRLVNAITKHFPIIEPTDIVTQEVDVSDGGVSHRHTTERQWNYFSRDRDVQLTLSSGFAFIQYKKYTTYEQAKEHFGGLIDALCVVFPDAMASRFGLRYINQIDGLSGDPTRWNEYINDDLVAARAFFAGDEALTRLVSICELKYDEVSVRFQYGMPNPDFPAQIKRPLFIIDLDASVAEAHGINRTINFMDVAHGHIQSLFERSIKPALREKMNGHQPVQQ